MKEDEINKIIDNMTNLLKLSDEKIYIGNGETSPQAYISIEDATDIIHYSFNTDILPLIINERTNCPCTDIVCQQYLQTIKKVAETRKEVISVEKIKEVIATCEDIQASDKNNFVKQEEKMRAYDKIREILKI